MAEESLDFGGPLIKHMDASSSTVGKEGMPSDLFKPMLSGLLNQGMVIFLRYLQDMQVRLLQ